jgi:(2R)-3-sulfolactate dehydrogenase (NADP+)
MAGGLPSRHVKPLKTPDGPPHDLGQFYILIDPASGQSFYSQFEQIAEGVALDDGARMPGQGKKYGLFTEVSEGLWNLVLELSS